MYKYYVQKLKNEKEVESFLNYYENDLRGDKSTAQYGTVIEKVVFDNNNHILIIIKVRDF